MSPLEPPQEVSSRAPRGVARSTIGGREWMLGGQAKSGALCGHGDRCRQSRRVLSYP
jgi:hypothetical protein